MSRGSYKSLKKLVISLPILLPLLAAKPLTPLLPGTPVVILQMKYDFLAELPIELTCRAGEYLKFMERPANGWIYVKLIDRTGSGLVPASYVDIAVNDMQNPISQSWLQETEGIMDISVSRVFATNKRFAYQVDVVETTGEKHVAKYYLDFYHLHQALTDEYSFPIPQLPGLLPHVSFRHDEKQLATQETCQRLHYYMKQLLRIPCIRASLLLRDFLQDLCSEPAPLVHSVSAQTLLTVSSLLAGYEETEPLDSEDSEGRNSDFSAGTNFHHNSTAETVEPKTPVFRETLPFNHKLPPSPHADSVKIDIVLGSDDSNKIVLNVRRLELTLLKTLRQIVLFKIYKDANLVSHYLLRPMHVSRHVTEEAVLAYLRLSERAFLRLERA